MADIGVLGLLASDPRMAFEALREKPRFAFPLWLAIGAAVLTTLWYYQVVDLPWLFEETMRGNPRMAGMDEAQRAKALQAMSGGVIKFTSVFAVAVMVVFVRLAEATYYLLAAKVTQVQATFRQWFSLSCWSSLPMLLTTIPAVFVLATSTNGQIENGSMNPLSLNELFFHRHMGEPAYSLLTTLGPLQLVGWSLAFIGVRTWSGRSALFSAVYVLLPPALVYGCWTLLALR